MQTKITQPRKITFWPPDQFPKAELLPVSWTPSSSALWNWRFQKERKKYSRKFKHEAVNLVTERGVSVVQASRDLDINHNVLRRWVMEFGADPTQAFPGVGQMKPEQLEIDRLRKEVARLKAERDILKNRSGFWPACVR